MFSKDQITDFTSTVVPFLHLTTRIPGKAHDDLFKVKGFRGFPSLCFMNADGEVLHKIPGNQRSLKALHSARENVERLLELTAKPESDVNAKRDLLVLQLEMGHVGFVDAVATSAKFDFSDAQRSKFQSPLVEALARMNLDDARAAAASVALLPAPKARAVEILTDLEIRAAMAPLYRPMKPYNPRTEKPPTIPYHLCWDLYVSGKLPSDKPQVNSMYWRGVLETAEKKADIAAFDRALTKLREAYGEGQERYLASLQKRLDALRAAAARK